jgi:hypothetical protein
MFSLLPTARQRFNFVVCFKVYHPMKFHLRLWPLALVLFAFVSCVEQEDPIEYLPSTSAVSAQSNDVVWEWSELYLTIERDLQGFRPAPTCRALAYINMGAYETAVPGMSTFKSLSEVISGFPTTSLEYEPSQIDWAIAVNAYYARAFSFFLYNATEEHLNDIRRIETQQLADLSRDVPQGIVNASIEWGQKVANTMISYSETDTEGASQVRVGRPSDYFPPVGDGLWVPTLPDLSSALFPYWGKVRVFAANESDLLSPPPAFEYNTNPTSRWYKDNQEVADAVNNMTDENRWIAEFWSDDLTGLTFSPPARIIAIANQVIKLEKMNLEQTLHFYCKLGIGLNDASVGAWKSKYTYNTERPETFIRKYIDPDFKPILGEAIGNPGLTPSFPGYPSGHSTFAGVCEVLFDNFFGAQYEFTDHCHFGRTEFAGYPRTYTTWKELAEEDAYSRIPLGVHIRLDCSEGLRLGQAIASKAVNLNLEK